MAHTHLIAIAFTALLAAAAYLHGSSPTFALYNLPIAIPFALFLLERWTFHRTSRSARRIALDLAVLALALTRAFYPGPFVSGHLLFLTHAALTGQTPSTRVSATLVLLEVLFMKLVLFHDPVTPAGALTLALLAHLAWNRQRSAVRSPS